MLERACLLRLGISLAIAISTFSGPRRILRLTQLQKHLPPQHNRPSMIQLR